MWPKILLEALKIGATAFSLTVLKKKYDDKVVEHQKEASKKKEPITLEEAERRAMRDIAPDLSTYGLPLGKTGDPVLDHISKNFGKKIGKQLTKSQAKSRLENQYEQLLDKLHRTKNPDEINKIFEQLNALDEKLHPEFNDITPDDFNHDGIIFIKDEGCGASQQGRSLSVKGEILPKGQPTGSAAPVDPNAVTPSMTEDQQSEYLKNDPGATRMHYDPSQMTERQQAKYLRDYFYNPNDPGEVYYENKLMEDFGRGARGGGRPGNDDLPWPQSLAAGFYDQAYRVANLESGYNINSYNSSKSKTLYGGVQENDYSNFGAYAKIPDSSSIQAGDLNTSSTYDKIPEPYSIREDSYNQNSSHDPNNNYSYIRPDYQGMANSIGNSVTNFLNEPSWKGAAIIAINVGVLIAIRVLAPLIFSFPW